MRFALTATVVAAVVAVPMALAASGPRMSSQDFLSSVRCAAYAEQAAPDADLAAVKYELNAEARRQPAETVAAARAIALQAVNTGAGADQAMLAQERTAACSTALVADLIEQSNAA